jgi:uncharacterized Zn-binding protein involved in type VI secretion
MDTGAWFVFVLLFVILLGIIVYYVYTVKTQTHADIAAEKQDRTDNVQSVVDQANVVNSNIFNSVNTLNNTVNTLNNTVTNTFNGLNSLFTLTSNVGIAGGSSNVSLLNYPGYKNVSMNLLQQVNATSGLTASGLNPSNQVKFCSSQTGSCIQIPNSNGDLYFTPMASSAKSSIIMDAPYMSVTGAIEMGNNTGIAQQKGNLTLISQRNAILASTATDMSSVSAIGVGKNQAGMGVADNTSQKFMEVTVTPQNVQISNSRGGAPAVTITPTSSNVVIDSPNIVFTGNVAVTGTMTASSNVIQKM